MKHKLKEKYCAKKKLIVRKHKILLLIKNLLSHKKNKYSIEYSISIKTKEFIQI